MVASNPLISLDNVSRSYQSEGAEVTALKQVSLTIQKGEFVAIMGQSGSGKSTMMNILGCLDKPSAGTYRIHGQSVADLDDNQLAALRLKTFGFVFQRYQLLSTLTAQQNVALPAIYSNTSEVERNAHAAQLLVNLGLRIALPIVPVNCRAGSSSGCQSPGR